MGRGSRSAAVGKCVYSAADVAKHCTQDDAWVIIDNEVYDVSGWTTHPGGKVIFSHAGADATSVFSAFHTEHSSTLLPGRHIGSLHPKDALSLTPPLAPGSHAAIEADYRALRGSFHRMGLFQASALYYVYKTLSTLAFGAAGWALTAYFPGEWWAVWTSAVLFGFFFQQCGWLSHDYLHHQVFGDWRVLGDAMGLFVGNVCQSFSVNWWKNKHNTHHAIPNMLERDRDTHDGDPDIDTLPVLAWSRYFAEKAARLGGMVPFLVKYQSWMMFPALLMARLAWVDQSFRWVLGAEMGWGVKGRTVPLRYPLLELPLLLSHYVWYALMAWQGGFSIAQFLVHFAVANALGGFFIGVAFIVGHNGMDIVASSQRPAFFKWQVATTRNVDDDPIGFTGWFTGGLGYQIEHHLYPSLPRHSLPLAKPFVQALCKKHNIPYHSTSLPTGLVEVLQCLDKVSLDFIAEFPAM